MKNIRLNDSEEFLAPRIGAKDGDPIGVDQHVGRHVLCEGSIIAAVIAPEWSVFSCRKCNLRVKFPRTYKTWSQLRVYFPDPKDNKK